MSTERYVFSEHEFRTYYSGARLLYISREKYGGDWYSMPHIHKFTEFFFVVGGSGKFQIRDNAYGIATGDMVLLNPQVEHTETSVVEAPLEYIVLGIEGVKLVTGLDSAEGFNIIHFDEAADDISNYMHRILAEAKRCNSGYEDVCQSLLHILLINLMRHTKITPRTEDAFENASPKAASAKAYIDMHFRENITLQSIAEAANSNKYYLSHIFSQAHGISPLQYVQTLRLENSKYLLRTTNYSLKQIASMSGFSSISYFTQRFSKVENMTPSSYLNMCQSRMANGT